MTFSPGCPSGSGPSHVQLVGPGACGRIEAVVVGVALSVVTFGPVYVDGIITSCHTVPGDDCQYHVPFSKKNRPV